MPTIDAVNYRGMAKVTIAGRIHGQTTNNVLFFGSVGELSGVDWAAELTELATTLMTCIVTTLLPGLSQDWYLEAVKAQLVEPVVLDEVEVQPETSSMGALSEGLPSTNAIVLSLRTGFAGKSHRGRMYLAGIPESDTTQSQLISGDSDDALIAFIACLITNFKSAPAGGWNLGVYSRKLGGTEPYSMAAGFKAVSNIIRRQVIATMRSRRIGHGG